MYSKIFSATILGLSAYIVSVETDIGMGMPSFEMSGDLSAGIKEARERVRVSIKNSGIELKPQRIVVNISPADLKKDGTGFDLPIAMGILTANGVIGMNSFNDTIVIGELSLDGTVNSVRGILPSICKAKEEGYKKCIIPYENLDEASIVKDIEIIGVKSLRDLIDHLNGTRVISYDKSLNKEYEHNGGQEVDFSDINGQKAAKRATLIAVCGMHNIMFVGPPGSGKTMIARRIPTIMPKLTFDESLELTKIYSVAGDIDTNSPMIRKRPFRSPHHNVTQTALLGGGRIPKPGEVSLSAKGVLFLDEMTEFKTSVLESLRQPLEDKKITISRLSYTCTYPADFMLVAAINPCKCGFYPDRNKCNCSDYEIKRYIGRISRPMWDRFDMNVHVDSARFEDFNGKNVSSDDYNSENMRNEVEKVRRIQIKRFENKKINFNSEMSSKDIKQYCKLGTRETKLMKDVYTKFNMTARGYYKILKVARTIADLDNSEEITVKHLSEAVSYRSYNTNV